MKMKVHDELLDRISEGLNGMELNIMLEFSSNSGYFKIALVDNVCNKIFDFGEYPIDTVAILTGLTLEMEPDDLQFVPVT
jgi:hypothetical protein